MTRQELRDKVADLKDDLAVCEDDIVGLKFELEDVIERLKAARAEKARIKTELAAVRGLLKPVAVG
jgi:hypothetical protein